jgi:hypothetical protein
VQLLLRPIIDLFSSVKLGIALLITLFVYSSIGSAGILYPASLVFWDLDNWNQVVIRHMPGLEMTEYEWFQWWPFVLLIVLICANITVTTLRRIPFRPVNYGVWMIHTGIITLALGSIWYFTRKVEGETPVIRRRLAIVVPGADAATLTVLPGNRIDFETSAGRYQFQIAEIIPDWEILTGSEEGERAYAVSVLVRTPEQTFIRQLIDGHPEFTEDVIPGEGRAVKILGETLVDDSLTLSLVAAPQQHFFLAHTDAIYVREAGSPMWFERPIDGLPRYNDYVASADEVWPVVPGSRLPIMPLAIDVNEADSDDPLAGMDFRIGSYLRYAFDDTRRVSGGGQFDPILRFRLEGEGAPAEHVELLASDPARNSFAGGFARFTWVSDEVEHEAAVADISGSIAVRVAESGDKETIRLSDLAPATETGEAPYRGVTGTPYEWRLVALENYQPDANGRIGSFAIVEMRTPERAWHRVLFSADFGHIRARDVAIDEQSTGGMRELPLDEGIELTYLPPAQILFIGGPEERNLRAVRPPARLGGEPIALPLSQGSRWEIDPSIEIIVDEFAACSKLVTKPLIVPNAQRRRELDLQLRMIRLELPDAEGGAVSVWLKYHEFPFSSEDEGLPGFPYEPTTITLSDGRRIELLYSRRRMLLPAPIVLQDFEVEYHVGGFSGDALSVEEWYSHVSFEGTTATQSVAVNKPGKHDGYWFFQSRWDPPNSAGGRNGAPSAGLNFTVLGVGNRDGVHVQLAGCVIAVIGMLYAFYVKPIIKRRKRARVLDELVSQDDAPGRESGMERPAEALVEAGR